MSAPPVFSNSQGLDVDVDVDVAADVDVDVAADVDVDVAAADTWLMSLSPQSLRG